MHPFHAAIHASPNIPGPAVGTAPIPLQPFMLHLIFQALLLLPKLSLLLQVHQATKRPSAVSHRSVAEQVRLQIMSEPIILVAESRHIVTNISQCRLMISHTYTPPRLAKHPYVVRVITEGPHIFKRYVDLPA